MEALIDQFTFLSNQAPQHKNFDPSRIEDAMKLYEVEAYKSWAAMELDQEKEVAEAEISMKESEDYQDITMEEFHRFEEEMDRMAKAEYDARKMGKSSTETAVATMAAKKFVEAAVSSATASTKTAVKCEGSLF